MSNKDITAAEARPFAPMAYKLKDAARELSISEKSVRRLIARGLIKPSRALRHVLVPATELAEFLRRTS